MLFVSIQSINSRIFLKRAAFALFCGVNYGWMAHAESRQDAELVQYQYVTQQPAQYQQQYQQQAVPQGWESLTPISAQQAKQIKTQQMAAQPAGGYAVCQPSRSLQCPA